MGHWAYDWRVWSRRSISGWITVKQVIHTCSDETQALKQGQACGPLLREESSSSGSHKCNSRPWTPRAQKYFRAWCQHKVCSPKNLVTSWVFIKPFLNRKKAGWGLESFICNQDVFRGETLPPLVFLGLEVHHLYLQINSHWIYKSWTSIRCFHWSPLLMFVMSVTLMSPSDWEPASSSREPSGNGSWPVCHLSLWLHLHHLLFLAPANLARI